MNSKRIQNQARDGEAAFENTSLDHGSYSLSEYYMSLSDLDGLADDKPSDSELVLIKAFLLHTMPHPFS